MLHMIDYWLIEVLTKGSHRPTRSRDLFQLTIYHYEFIFQVHNSPYWRLPKVTTKQISKHLAWLRTSCFKGFTVKEDIFFSLQVQSREKKRMVLRKDGLNERQRQGGRRKRKKRKKKGQKEKEIYQRLSCLAEKMACKVLLRISIHVLMFNRAYSRRSENSAWSDCHA